MKKRMRILVPASVATPPGSRADSGEEAAPAFAPFPREWAEPMAWRQPRVFERRWSLESARGTHLVLAHDGLFSRHWRAEGLEGRWGFDLGWRNTSEVTDAQGHVVFGARRGWLGRWHVTLADGRVLVFRMHWLAGWTLEDEEGREWLKLANRFSLLRIEATLEVSEQARRLAELMPLVAFVSALAFHGRRRRRH